MKQTDIFGGEIEVTEVKIKTAKTIKDKFRDAVGYKEGHKCANCQHFKTFGYHYRTYFKCELLGISHSTATDVHKKDVACNEYKEKEIENK